MRSGTESKLESERIRGDRASGAAFAELRRAGQALAVIAAFVGFGLTWAVVLSVSLVAPEGRAYAEQAMPEASPPAPLPLAESGATTRTWLVDGYNVLCTTLQGGEERADWWNEAQRERLLESASGFGEKLEAGGELFVVFDGAQDPGEQRREALWQVFAPSADEWLVRRVRQAKDAERIVVVSADRKVVARVRHAGARVVSPRDFIAACGS